MSSDSIKRIMAEVRELAALNAQPTTLFHAAPLETDLFEWHFTVRGPPDTPFEGGLYHGRILLPPEYPLKAPEIILLTPNGRFEVGTRICLSVTSHHNETWQPSWGIRTILTALIGFMPSTSEGLGALDYPPEDRRALAKKSLAFHCPRCGIRTAHQFPPPSTTTNTTTNPSHTSQPPTHTAQQNEETQYPLIRTTSAEAPASASAGATATATATAAAASAAAASHGNHRVHHPIASSSAASSSLGNAQSTPALLSESPLPVIGHAVASASASSSTNNTSEAVRSPGPAGPSSKLAGLRPSPPSQTPTQITPVARPERAVPVQSRRASRHDERETGLLYLAYAIAVAIFAIIARRIVNIAM